MNRNEIPLNARDAFDRLADEQFFADKDVATALAALDDANAKHGAAVERYVELRCKLESRASEADVRVSLIEDLTAERTQLLPDFFLSGVGADAIDALADQIAMHRRFVDDFALARPGIEARLRDCDRETASAVTSQQGAQDHYDDLLFRLKLAEAERLALM